jgi:hypothetical protein
VVRTFPELGGLPGDSRARPTQQQIQIARNGRERTIDVRRIGVSGFLISWAMRRATSAQAEVRCAVTRSVMSSRVR